MYWHRDGGLPVKDVRWRRLNRGVRRNAGTMIMETGQHRKDGDEGVDGKAWANVGD